MGVCVCLSVFVREKERECVCVKAGERCLAVKSTFPLCFDREWLIVARVQIDRHTQAYSNFLSQKEGTAL